MTEQEIHILELEQVLRDIAYYVGAGGYNSSTVDPKIYYDKIIGGIDSIIDRLAETQAVNKQLRK